MPSDDATAGTSRFARIKRLSVVVVCLLILSGGAWVWFGSRKLTTQEQGFVGRWQVTVSSQKNLSPPYVNVWEITPDRRLTIWIDDPKSPGNLIAQFDCNWKVRNNKLVVDFYPPRNMRDYVHRLQEFVESTRRLSRMPSQRTLYDVKSSGADQHVLWTQQTFKPVSYEVYDLVREKE